MLHIFSYGESNMDSDTEIGTAQRSLLLEFIEWFQGGHNDLAKTSGGGVPRFGQNVMGLGSIFSQMLEKIKYT